MLYKLYKDFKEEYVISDFQRRSFYFTTKEKDMQFKKDKI